MEKNVVRLTASDYDETVDFLNMVFSMNNRPHDFPAMLPTLYQRTEESMGHHYAIRSSGRIQAVVGIYPTTLVVGEMSLKLARIGAVSTHPYARGRGLMGILLNRVRRVLEEGGYDLAWLAGLRHRYLHFGYEKAGVVWTYTFTKNNLKHVPHSNDPIQLELVTENDPALIEKLLSFHKKQSAYCTRSPEDFFTCCSHWYHKLLAAYCAKELVGYLVVNQGETEVTELAAGDEETQLKMLEALIQRSSTQSIRVGVNPLDVSFMRLLEKYAEDVSLSTSGNWQILNWEKVVQACLRAKSQVLPLDDGVISLEIIGYGSVEIGAAESDVYCVPTAESGIIALDGPRMTRFLFGPHSPQTVISLPSRAKVLQNWCPLPLYLGRQDFA